MTEERLIEIRSNINYLSGLDYDVKDEVELYNEVIRLREIIDELERWTNKHFIGTLGDTFIHKIEELKNEEK